MKKLALVAVVLIFMLIPAGVASAADCEDCDHRKCNTGGNHTVCDEIGTNGCIASGTCPHLIAGQCIPGDMLARVASVETVVPPREMLFQVASFTPLMMEGEWIARNASAWALLN